MKRPPLKRLLLAFTSAIAIAAAATPAAAGPLAPIIVAAIGFTGTAATIATFVINTAFAIALSAATQKLLGPKQASSSQERQASVLSMQLGEEPRRAIFGRAVTGGHLLDVFNFGGANRTDWEVRVVKAADHKCDALEGFYIGDAFYAFSADGVQSGFNGQLEVYWKNGDPAQVASSYLTTNSPNRLAGTDIWDTNAVAASQAYVVVAYKADAPNAAAPVWPQGRPEFKFKVRGKLCYDPRKDSTVTGGSGSHRWTTPSTWEWSENARVCDYNYDRGIYAKDQVTDPTQLLIGRGLTAVEAKPERVFAAANVCDEDVALKAGGTEKRYKVGGVIFANQPFRAVKEMFAAAMAGVICKRDGGVEIEPGAAKSVVAELTDDDLVIGESFTSEKFLPDNDRVNVVVPRYTAPDQLWRNSAAPVRRSTSDITADGGMKPEDLALDIVTSGTQAQRCGEIKRRLNRKERRSTAVLSPKQSHLEDGDWVGFTSRRFGATPTRFVFRIDAAGVRESYRVPVVLREIATTCFDWVAASDESTPGQAPVDEIGSLPALALTSVSIVQHTLTGTDGTQQPAVKATWATPVDSAIKAVRIEVRKSGTTDAAFDRCDDPNQGKLITTQGVIGGTTNLEARLIPLSYEGRPLTATSWTAVTTAGFSFPALVAALSDGVLTPAEKRLTFVPTVDGFIGPRTNIRAQATALGLTTGTSTARANYETSQTNLDGLLTALNTAGPTNYNNYTGNTTVPSPPTLLSCLTDCAKYETDLQTAIDVAQKALADDALSDGVLTQAEKRDEVNKINALIANRVALRALATALNLTTGTSAERAAYETAATNLDSYLAGLTSPVAWNNFTDKTTISSPPTWRTRMEDAQKTERDLQSAVETVLKLKTQWVDTDGVQHTYRGVFFGVSNDGIIGRTVNPLTSTDTTLTVATHTVYLPDNGSTVTISLTGATFTGLGSDTTWSVFNDVLNTHFYAVDAPAGTYADWSSPINYLYVGAVRTAVAGTSTYNPPPYGGGGSIDYCVAADALVGPDRPAADACPGDELTKLTASGARLYYGQVQAARPATAPCVRIRTASGGLLTVSRSTPLVTRAAPDAPIATDLTAGELREGTLVPIAATWQSTVPTWDLVTAVEDAGVRAVVRISTWEGVFAATDDPAAPPILTHNYNKP